MSTTTVGQEISTATELSFSEAAARVGELPDPLISVEAAVDEGLLLLALERLESLPAVQGSRRERDRLSAGVRVAVGHLVHAQEIAPTSGVVALAAGRVHDVATTPERVEELGALVRDGDAWASDELAALAEASARKDDRRSWHAAERTARVLLDDATSSTRGSLLWILTIGAHRRGDAVAAAAMLSTLPGGDPARLPEIAAIAVSAQDSELGCRARAAAHHLMQRNAGVSLLSALSLYVDAVVDESVEAQRRSARALGELGRPLLHAGAAEHAGLLAEALLVYERCGAPADAGRVRRAMALSGVAPIPRSRDWDELTTAELRVVRLVAAGATNRRAAQELFLSPHTVSSHVRHAFEKLGINSRVELARLYAHRETGRPLPVS